MKRIALTDATIPRYGIWKRWWPRMIVVCLN